MSSNTENTEAKLAAYIDGQLDPAERAQIEQYLQSNPEHRKLLADMIAQRDTLRSLPREKAPPDIYDAIQAQLERSVLLDDSAQSVAPVIRHSRRSQLFGIAAILLLAVGLGGVLYFALPSTRPNAIEVATGGRSAATSDVASSASQPTTTLAYADEKSLDLSVTVATPKAKPAGPALAEGTAVALNPLVVSNSNEPNPTYQALADARDQVKFRGGHAGGLTQSRPGENGQLVLLVSTDNPSKANQEIASYLESNNIRWDTVNVPAEQVLYSRTADRNVSQLQPKVIGAARDKVSLAAPAAKGDSGGDADFAAKSKVLPEGATETEVDATRRQLGALEQVQTSPATLPAVTGSQVAHLEQKEQLTPPAAGQDEPESPQVAQQQVAASQYFYSISKDTAGQQYIVARGMTRQQAIALTDTLSNEGVARRARLIGQAPSRVPAAKWFDERRAAELKITPATSPAAETNKAPAEDLSGPTTEPILADVSQKEPALSSTLARKTEVQGEIAPASVQPATTLPSTLPAVPDAAEFAVTAPVAATQPSQNEPAVDLVILVEDESPVAAPATAPAITPATQDAPESR